MRNREKIFWDLLVNVEGLSDKQDENSAGSFGIGKNAPFAYSALNLVFTTLWLRMVDVVLKVWQDWLPLRKNITALYVPHNQSVNICIWKMNIPEGQFYLPIIVPCHNLIFSIEAK